MESVDSWQNWVVAIGYLSFTVFIIWQVIKPPRN